MQIFTKAILALAMTAAASTSAFAGGNADFTLVNKTGYAIREVYVSPSKAKNWGNDRLGRSVLANNQARALKFSDNAHCKQDLQVVFDDDNSEVVWENVDLCETEKLTLKYNRKSGEVSALQE